MHACAIEFPVTADLGKGLTNHKRSSGCCQEYVRRQQSNQVPTTAQVAAKMEYHGDKAEDAEELTAEELSQWWSRAFMRPGSSLLASLVFSLCPL